MRSLAVLACLVVCVLLTGSVAPTVAAPRTKQSCVRGNDPLLVAVNSRVIVSVPSAFTYACWTLTGRRLRLNQKSDTARDIDNGGFSAIDLAGRYVGVVDHSSGVDSEADYRVRVIDMSTRRTVMTTPTVVAPDQPDSMRIGPFHVFEDGSAAWSVEANGGTQIVLARPGDRPVVLDQAKADLSTGTLRPVIPADSFGVGGDLGEGRNRELTLYWTRDGVARSAPLQIR